MEGVLVFLTAEMTPNSFVGFFFFLLPFEGVSH